MQDKHGEVCPIDWKEGSETIKPTPKDSLSYFSGSEKKRGADAMNMTNGHANGTNGDAVMANGNAKRVKV